MWKTLLTKFLNIAKSEFHLACKEESKRKAVLNEKAQEAYAQTTNRPISKWRMKWNYLLEENYKEIILKFNGDENVEEG